MNVRRLLGDISVLLRFLSGEVAARAALARKLFVRTAADEHLLDVSPVIVAETFYTLTSFCRVALPSRRRGLASSCATPGRSWPTWTICGGQRAASPTRFSHREQRRKK